MFLKRLTEVTGTLFLRGLPWRNRFSYFIFSDKTKEIMTTQKSFIDYTEI